RAVRHRARAQPELTALRVALRLEADIQRRWRVRFDIQAGGERPRPADLVLAGRDRLEPARRVDDDGERLLCRDGLLPRVAEGRRETGGLRSGPPPFATSADPRAQQRDDQLEKREPARPYF